MQLGQIGQFARLALDLTGFLRNPATPASATTAILERLENRERNFLQLLGSAVYNDEDSPYRRLIENARWSFKRLREHVHAHGIERTLQELRDAGVYLDLEEFKSQKPVSRGGLEFSPAETDFDNRLAPRRGLFGKTSGTRSKGTRVAYDWSFISQESDNECLLYQAHGVLNSPVALWYPIHSSLAGIHNVIMNLKHHHPPAQWFSHTKIQTAKDLLMVGCAAVCARTAGLSLPWPETVGAGDAYKVAAWLAETRQKEGTAVLRTFTSSAVRVVKAALEKDLDISNCTIFTGGEPLTGRRHRFMQAAGVDILPRYVSTETGLIAGPCARPAAPDDMHVYLDRLAVIPGKTDGSLLFTTLLPTTGKVLLNTSLGDSGRLERRDCGCPLGRLGLDLHVSNVRSATKLTGEGMSVLIQELDQIVGGLVAACGGCPDDYQFQEAEDPETGLSRLTVVVHPALEGLDEGTFIATVLRELQRTNPRGRLASQLWRQSETLHLVRGRPRITGGQKQLLLVTDPGR